MPTANCANAEAVTLPMVINGAGDFCRVTTGNISEVNSWNTDRVEINGVGVTNSYQGQWSKNMPTKVDGRYVIRYIGKYPWSHLEVKGSGGSDSANSGSGSNGTNNANAGGNSSTNDNSGSAGVAAISNGRYNIVSSFSGMSLDVFGAAKDDGANVIQYSRNGGGNQQFDLEALGDGTYSIRAAHSGKALDVFQWNANDGAELRQWSYTGGKNQRWRIEDAGGGLFKITSAFSNKVIDVWQMNKTNGGAVKLYHWTGGQNQKWSFVRVDSNNNNNGNNGGSTTNYALQIGISGNGSTSVGAGSHSYKSGTTVTITATPASGSIFSGWSGAFTGNTNPLTITMDGNKSLTAMFMAQNNGNGNNNGSGNAVTDGLKTVASFPVGVAVNAGGENNSIVGSGTSAQQQALVFKHFDQMTAGNIMKMSYLHPSEGNFTYGQADEFISLARSHGLDVHGHTLIWHADYQVPGFMKNYGGDFAGMLRNHVQNIVRHFQGRVVSWDVVNEALADDGEGTVGNGLRSTVFSQKMGLNFIDQAFTTARATDSNVDLYYNDYNIEANGQKTRNLLALVDGMRSRGVPITGVGFQMHVSLDWPSIGAIEASLKAIADRGLKVKISEMDVGMRSAYSSLTAEAAARQKQRYHDIVAAYIRAVPPAQRAGITVWGVWDSDSWINQPGKPDWPLLFDANFQAKPALQGFADALQGR